MCFLSKFWERVKLTYWAKSWPSKRCKGISQSIFMNSDYKAKWIWSKWIYWLKCSLGYFGIIFILANSRVMVRGFRSSVWFWIMLQQHDESFGLFTGCSINNYTTQCLFWYAVAYKETFSYILGIWKIVFLKNHANFSNKNSEIDSKMVWICFCVWNTLFGGASGALSTK